MNRRTFMKASGIAACAATLGLSGRAVAEPGLDRSVANPRVREVKKVWERGYRGRPDRTVGYTDTGTDVRHPDVGPWNGVTIFPTADGLQLTTPDAIETWQREENKTQVAAEEWTGQATPGAYVSPESTTSEVVVAEFTPPDDAQVVTGVLSWDPYEDNTNDLELRLDVQTEDGWAPVATAATADMPETLVDIGVDPANTYRWVAELYLNSVSTYTLEYTAHTYEEPLETIDGGPFDFNPSAVDAPKLVGWMDAGFGDLGYAPFDDNGHGTHVSSIMAGTGQASTIDPDRVQHDAPNAVLTAGGVLEYEIDARQGTGVFASVEGAGVQVLLYGPDGRELDRSGAPFLDTYENGYLFRLSFSRDNSFTGDRYVVDHPTDDRLHDGPDDERTYTVVVRPHDGEAASTGRVESVAVGAFADADVVRGDRDADTGVSLHSGVAPDMSIVGMQGLSGPLGPLSDLGGDFTDLFNLRTVNMSWGPILDPLGLTTPPSGAAGGMIGSRVATIKEMASHGILSCISAGNSFTPGQSGAPATADEAINVAATGPQDGLTAYSSGGLVAKDEDADRTYTKVDVAAPGGYLADSVRAAKAKAEDGATAGANSVRDYVDLAGTSMAAPYTNGTVGLIAEAMEFTPDGDARRALGHPDAVTLPAPAETGYGDAMRLKSVLLGTATTTAFTAAPYHRAHAPTYEGPTGKDVYEGHGRINPDAAVDAVTRDLLPADARTDGDAIHPSDAPANAVYEHVISGAVGLNVPEDSRAVAGYVSLSSGTADVSVDVSHLSGGNQGLASGSPHVDLVVYDPAATGTTADGTAAVDGEPVPVASAQGTEGAASVEVAVPDSGSTYLVVAKLVNIPGVVNGFDVQAHLNLTVSFQASDLPVYTVTGSVSDGASVFTGGQTRHAEITVENTEDEGRIWVAYQVPEKWTVLDWGSAHVRKDSRVWFNSRLPANASHTFDLFFEAPEGSGQSGRYDFGPVEYLPEADGYRNAGEWNDVPGTTSTETVVGVSTNSGDTTRTATDTDGATDTGTAVDSTLDVLTDGSDGG